MWPFDFFKRRKKPADQRSVVTTTAPNQMKYRYVETERRTIAGVEIETKTSWFINPADSDTSPSSGGNCGGDSSGGGCE